MKQISICQPKTANAITIQATNTNSLSRSNFIILLWNKINFFIGITRTRPQDTMGREEVQRPLPYHEPIVVITPF